MPYFIYRIHRYGGLERLEDLPTFAAAAQRAKALRADPGRDADSRIKVVFAATDHEAEDLLTQERAPRPGLDGDE